MSEPTGDDVELANKLLDAWDNGSGTSKSELERIHWDDGSSHGRRFDRFIRQTLGVETTTKSKQTDRIADLEAQVRGLGRSPVGADQLAWEEQLLHARNACLSGLRVWNDPTEKFRTATFSLLFVTAWNSRRQHPPHPSHHRQGGQAPGQLTLGRTIGWASARRGEAQGDDGLLRRLGRCLVGGRCVCGTRGRLGD